MESNEQNLDEEFKCKLIQIRSYVLALNDITYMKPCCAWIQRLNNCSSEEKCVRNEFLTELCEQLRLNKLEEPFTAAPPNGPLKSSFLMPHETGSWSDMSTVTNSTCDNAVPNKIQETSIKPLRNSEAECGVNKLSNEVEYLKLRLTDLITVKRTLQESHNAIVKQLEQSIQNLQKRLQEENHKNSEYQNTIRTLEEKIKNMENLCENIKDGCDYQQKFEESLVEINTMKENQLIAMKELESQYTKKMSEMEAEWQEKLNNLEMGYNEKVSSLVEQHDKQLFMKTEEILKLEQAVEDEHNRMQQEIDQIKLNVEDSPASKTEYINKITYMQKCIIKMEKLLRRYEKHYSKKVANLQAELMLKDSTMQIQLTSQRAQMLATMSTEKQNEIEEVVSQLEQRYRLLLENQQALSSLNRRQDLVRDNIMPTSNVTC